MDTLLAEVPAAQMRMLHFAPEPFFRERFKRAFGGYETADIDRRDVDHRADLQALPMPSASYDIVYASHVLEDVADDHAALEGIRRILRPGGIAILPVPIVAASTLEYDAPNPRESMHVRAPGVDYFDRYRQVFNRVRIFDSESFSERFQLYAFERRPEGTFRLTDYVPVCRVSGRLVV
jgi:SAM-dependent methyltransferase